MHILWHLRTVSPAASICLRLTPLEYHTVQVYQEVLKLWGFVFFTAGNAHVLNKEKSDLLLVANDIHCARNINPFYMSSRKTCSPAMSTPMHDHQSENSLSLQGIPVFFDVPLSVSDFLDFLALLSGTKSGVLPGKLLSADSRIATALEDPSYRRIELCKLFRTGVRPPAIARILHSKACRGAVMFGTKLTRKSCVALLKLLPHCGLPFQCAHGRPAVLPLVTLLKQPQKLSTLALHG